MKHYHTVDLIAIILLVVGGINWGFIGLLDFDIIGAVFGITLARIIFIAMGLAAVWRVIYWFQSKKH